MNKFLNLLICSHRKIKLLIIDYLFF
jgi:hypothetical protein